MALPTPAPGLVICYSYLWRDQAARGEAEGRKDRPCAVVLTASDDDGETIVYVAPISHSVSDHDSAVEIPTLVKRRLGLDASPSWIITRELNQFVWPGYDLRPIARQTPDVFAWGFLPMELLDAVKQRVIAHQRAGRLNAVDRR